MPMSEDVSADEKLADAIRLAIESATAAGNHVLVADLLSILRIVPKRDDNLKLSDGPHRRSENCIYGHFAQNAKSLPPYYTLLRLNA